MTIVLYGLVLSAWTVPLCVTNGNCLLLLSKPSMSSTQFGIREPFSRDQDSYRKAVIARPTSATIKLNKCTCASPPPVRHMRTYTARALSPDSYSIPENMDVDRQPATMTTAVYGLTTVRHTMCGASPYEASLDVIGVIHACARGHGAHTYV